ncbi:hypothetical protein PUNSTDRAFT_33929, partial [Punctularia strigosozonata HHB-11173 SS5]|uniref:uncharacterized protein n=1 Tax=Punctularia strigosozonata (strain HHB-11173) TaxID=741275 RepID=UPI000441801E
KKANQWQRWQSVTIPELVEPYMEYVRATDHMTTNRPLLPTCQCGDHHKTLNVLVVFIDRLEQMDIPVCTPTSAARALLARGLFPCAPQAPSVAFDLNMLELVATLFVNTAPNVTAWATTLESFLSVRNYKLTTRNSLRRRFGNALNWYNYLIDHVRTCTSSAVELSRHILLQQQEEEALNGCQSKSLSLRPRITEEPHHNGPRSQSDLPGGRCYDKEEREGQLADRNIPRGNRPSAYLRSRCVLCFGGTGRETEELGVDSIICLDACFTQKRRASGRRDPERHHPASVFLREDEITAMERIVEEKRQGRTARKGSRKHGASQSAPKRGEQPDATLTSGNDGAEDKCEGPLKLPNSVLDGCESSFKAADEQREKASTNFFDDTGLMALVCRHDRVLWMANITSAGERQHYAIALLDKFFHHVPKTFRAGVLYDIGCQLHRSCFKWGLLENYRDRIVFGISVFHAYGHQWACQVIYHPRKCECFGLSDGEGCERVWSALEHLVPGLRVSGYYQRFYVINLQLHHLDRLHLRSAGERLLRKYEACRQRAMEAQNGLRKCNLAVDFLRDQWTLQQTAQTKPLRNQVKDAGAKTIDSILALQDQQAMIDAHVAKIERAICKGRVDADANSRREELLNERGRVLVKRARLEDSLDLRSRQNLRSLRGSRYLTARINALTLKTRIRELLIRRKFELSKMERSFHTQSSDRKLTAHTTNAVHRREPTIQSLTRKYNALCTEMANLVENRQAPTRAVPPTPIDMEKLWGLDVDDNIWQDVGLVDEEDGDCAPPRWLTDAKVKEGIRHMLSADRCQEELARIMAERRHMQIWLQEEWKAVEHALDRTDISTGLHNQIFLYRKELLELAITWKGFVSAIPTNDTLLDVWGPSESEM